MKKPLFIGLVVAIIVLGAGGVLLASSGGQKTSTAKVAAKDPNGLDAAMDEMQGMDMSGSSNSTAKSVGVIIKNFAFTPASLTIKKGATVTWTNQDSATHTVTETDGQTGPKSDDLTTGKSYSFTFDTVGTYKYDCSIHPNMTATVTVTN